ncbi:MAG: hypothetical protein OIF55_06435 [Amphritea sp.]|nr:hypothetical protein [Amphritea sp.]
MRKQCCFALVTGVLFSTQVFAHYPVMICDADSQTIRCEVGFTDGSKAVGKPVRLFSYEEELLGERKSDRFSRVEFERPAGDFYLQFDSGHEFPVEVDVGEL